MCFVRWKRSRTDRTARRACAVVAAAFAAGCAVVPRAIPIEPEGRIDVLGPEPGFSADALPSDWVVQGDIAAARLDLVVKDGVPALRVAGGGRGFILARLTDAPLPVSPYLSWARLIEPPAADVHPVGLVVGFHGGDPSAPSRGARPLAWLGTALPPHDRRLAIGWGIHSSERDYLEPSDAGARIRRYVRRTAPEALTSWRLDTVDLADLYARAWPDDDGARVRVAFIGIAVDGGRPATAYLSGIRLSR